MRKVATVLAAVVVSTCLAPAASADVRYRYSAEHEKVDRCSSRFETRAEVLPCVHVAKFPRRNRSVFIDVDGTRVKIRHRRAVCLVGWHGTSLCAGLPNR